MGWQWLLPAARGDDRWRLGRRLLDRSLRPGATVSYRPMVQTKAHSLLSRLLANPDQWEAHFELSVEFGSNSHYTSELTRQIFRFQAELILAITYGYEVQERDDKMVDAAKRMTKFGEDRILPGALLVNHIPICM